MGPEPAPNGDAASGVNAPLVASIAKPETLPEPKLGAFGELALRIDCQALGKLAGKKRSPGHHRQRAAGRVDRIGEKYRPSQG